MSGLIPFITDNWLKSKNSPSDTFRIDVEETDQEYLVYAEVPGIPKNEISLAINEGRLTIFVDRGKNTKEEKKNYIHQERCLVSMSRSVYLANANVSNIKAKLEDGLLTVNVPKQEQVGNLVKIAIE